MLAPLLIEAQSCQVYSWDGPNRDSPPVSTGNVVEDQWGGDQVGKKQRVHKVNHGLMVIYQVFHFLPW